MKPVVLALSLLCLPHLADAAPVALDLTGEDFIQSTADQGLQGFFPQAGFLVTAQSNESPAPGQLYDLTTVGDGATGIDVGVNSVLFSPQSGATFDLEAVTIPRFYIGLYAVYTARDTAAPPSDALVEDVIPLLYENTYLRGFKRGGEVVTARFLPYDFGNLEELTPPNVAGRQAIAVNDDPVFTEAEFGPGFEDLLALEVSTGQGLFGSVPPPSQPAECRLENLARVDPRFALSGFCTGTPFPGGTLEDIEVQVEQLGVRNDTLYIALEGITVRPDDVPSEMAPVPVPAASPLLGSALVLLGAGAARRGRQRGLLAEATWTTGGGQADRNGASGSARR